MAAILLVSLLSVVAGEWTGLVRFPTASEYRNVTLVQARPQRFQANLDLVTANFSFNATASKLPLVLTTQLLFQFYNSSQDLEELLGFCEARAVPYVLLVTDDNVTFEDVGQGNVTVFTIPQKQGAAMMQEVQGMGVGALPVPVFLAYYELLDCAELHFLVRVFAGSTAVTPTQIWAVFLVAWVCNNSYWNARSVRFSHKLLTFVLVFKAIGVYCSFSLYNSCPFERVTAGLLELVQNQFRTLYETAYLSLLLVLCKGFLVTREVPSRTEFNHLAVLASTVYVTVSAYNIMGEQIGLMVFAMYAALWIHCTYYSLGVCRVVIDRLALSRRNRVPDLITAWQAKKTLFLTFAAVAQFYFFGELTVHLIIRDWSFGQLSGYNVVGVNVSVHEGLELLVLGVIFFLFRARPRGPFFEVMGEERAPPRQTTHYHTDYFVTVGAVETETQVGTPVVIVNPGELWESEYPFAKATLAFVDSTKPSKRSAFSVELPDRP